MIRMTVSLPMRRSGFDAPATRDMVQAAEESGFWGVTAPDHIVAPTAWARAGGGEHWPDPFTLLGFVAALTTELRLITHVIVLPYRSPYAVAKAIASVDHLSGGRAVLGVGSGYLREEFEILGASFEDRGRITDEAIRTIKGCWTDGDIPGIEARIAPQPVQPGGPPIWVGGNSMRALRRAVELGDCWAPFNLTDEQLSSGIARASTLGRRVEIAAPVGRIQRDEVTVGRGVGGDEAIARAGALRALGVDVVKVGFAGETADAWMANLRWFADAAHDLH